MSDCIDKIEAFLLKPLTLGAPCLFTFCISLYIDVSGVGGGECIRCEEAVLLLLFLKSLHLDLVF